MGLGNNLRGALRWSAAEEAAIRISAVRSQVEKSAVEAKGGDNQSTEQLQKQLRGGMMELDAIRQLLHESISDGNKQFVASGQKDAVLHHALEKGLVELETVRKRLVTVLRGASTEVPQPSQPAPMPTATPQQNFNEAKAEAQGPARGFTGSKRPPSATKRGPMPARPMSASHHGPSTTATPNGTGTNLNDFWGPQTKGATAQSRAGVTSTSGAKSRPMSATATGASRRYTTGGTTDVRPGATTQPENVVPQPTSQRQMPRTGWGDEPVSGQQGGSSSTTDTFGSTQRRATASNTVPPAPPPVAQQSTFFSSPSQQGNNTNNNAGSGNQNGQQKPVRPQASKFRPASAPNRARGVGGGDDEDDDYDTQPVATAQQQQQPQQQAQTSWGKYQDWAQNVLNRVQNRRVQQQQQKPFGDNGAFGDGPSSSTSTPVTPNSVPLQSAGATTTVRPTSAKPTTGPGGATTSTTPLAGTSANVGVGSAASMLRRMNSGGNIRPGSAAQGAGTGASAPAKLDAGAQALREQGNVLFQQKRYAESAECYSKAIAIEPNSETLYCNRAAAYLMASRFEDALNDSLKAVDIDPTHVKAHWRAAKAYLYLGNGEQAKQYYTAAGKLADAANDAEAIAVELRTVDLVEKCRRCIRLREWNDAVRCADGILEVFPPTGPCSSPWQCLKAEALLNIDPQEAGTLLARLCQEDPKNPEAWFLRAKALFYAGHDAVSTNSALGHIQRALEVDPKHTKSTTLQTVINTFAKLRDEGNSAYAAGKWQDAYVAYTKSLTVDAYNNSLKAIILCNRAAVCIQCERWKDAMDDINQSIGFNPQNAKAYARRARIHQHLNNFDAAVKDLQVAVQMYPSAENQERLTQAIELKNSQARQKTGTAGTGPQGAGAAPGGADPNKFRYFNFANGQQQAGGAAGAGTGGGASRPSTAGAKRPGQAGARPQSAQPKPRVPTHYETLGIDRKCDEKVIIKAYREAALKWHPDKWATGTEQEKQYAENIFKEIATAYGVLRDVAKRRQYDLTI